MINMFSGEFYPVWQRGLGLCLLRKKSYISPFIIVSIYNNYKVPYFIINYSYIYIWHYLCNSNYSIFKSLAPLSWNPQYSVFLSSKMSCRVALGPRTLGLWPFSGSLLPSIAIYCHRKNQKLHRRMRNQLSQWLEDEKLGEASPSLDTRGYFDDWPNKHR